MIRKFRNAVYEIVYAKGESDALIADGEKMEGDFLPYTTGKHRILCIVKA